MSPDDPRRSRTAGSRKPAAGGPRTAYFFLNEKLPINTAHDVYKFLTCFGLARAGLDVTLFCAEGSAPDDVLARHYLPAHEGPLPFRIERLARSVMGLGRWGFRFAASTRAAIAAGRPDLAVFSTRKLAAAQVGHKVPGVKYVFEAHQLAQYSVDVPTAEPHALRQDRAILQDFDLVVVTTALLESVLRDVFDFKGKSAVARVGSPHAPLPPGRGGAGPVQLFYAGQLYEEQGVGELLDAIANLDGIRLNVVGGRPERLAAYSSHAAVQSGRAILHGFVAPKVVAEVVAAADVFAAPFRVNGRKPYTAHTKLVDYARWGRPIVAPDLPVVREHLPTPDHWRYLYDPARPGALAERLAELAREREALERTRAKLMEYLAAHPGAFSLAERSRAYAEVLAAA
jgi:glycosyltransferase involved in cell wall biosynthesis